MKRINMKKWFKSVKDFFSYESNCPYNEIKDEHVKSLFNEGSDKWLDSIYNEVRDKVLLNNEFKKYTDASGVLYIVDGDGGTWSKWKRLVRDGKDTIYEHREHIIYGVEDSKLKSISEDTGYFTVPKVTNIMEPIITDEEKRVRIKSNRKCTANITFRE